MSAEAIIWGVYSSSDLSWFKGTNWSLGPKSDKFSFFNWHIWFVIFFSANFHTLASCNFFCSVILTVEILHAFNMQNLQKMGTNFKAFFLLCWHQCKQVCFEFQHFYKDLQTMRIRLLLFEAVFSFFFNFSQKVNLQLINFEASIYLQFLFFCRGSLYVCRMQVLQQNLENKPFLNTRQNCNPISTAFENVFCYLCWYILNITFN